MYCKNKRTQTWFPLSYKLEFVSFYLRTNITIKNYKKNWGFFFKYVKINKRYYMQIPRFSKQILGTPPRPRSLVRLSALQPTTNQSATKQILLFVDSKMYCEKCKNTILISSFMQAWVCKSLLDQEYKGQ